MVWKWAVVGMLVLFNCLPPAYADDDKITKGDTIPELTMENLNGESHSLDKPDGHVTLVYFWASWCKPCQKTLPKYMEIYRKFKNASFDLGTAGFTLYAISLDKTNKAWKRAVKRHRVPDHLTVSDLQMWDSKGVDKFDIGAIPASFIVDGSGVVRAVNVKNKLNDFLEEHKQ